MSEPLDLAGDASRLLFFGLQPRRRASKIPEYGELLHRYRNTSLLRSFVETIADGLGLDVLGATEQGLVLGAQDESPFSQRLADYRRATTVEERMCHGLIQVAIAAWCYPTGSSLEGLDGDALGAQVPAHVLCRYLVNLCEELKRRATADPEFDNPELEEAWRGILSRAATKSTSDNRAAAKTLVGMVTYALKHLEQGGLMRRANDNEGGTWQPLPAYRIQVRELAAHDLYRWVRDAASAN